MRTDLDLVAEARAHVPLVPLSDVDRALAQAPLLIDVHEESEYAVGHLPGAVHMSRGTVEARLGALPQEQDCATPLPLYCRPDARATLMALSLRSMGYTRGQVIKGGHATWVSAGKPRAT
jgi:rhodanese-related sulfurtransferase